MAMWVIAERPGYFGRHRDERHRQYDAEYGSENWRLSWVVAGRTFSLAAALMLYEDAYCRFLESSTDALEDLIASAADVYDDALSNVESGLDYSRQETGRTHLQDVALRRCLVRLGRWFSGSALIQIRDSLGEHPLSITLSPGRVPFHRPDLLLSPELVGWWLPGSTESFYQSNKVLEVRRE